MTKSELLPISRPILFNTEMVRAIINGKKTQTRRAIKPQPTYKCCLGLCTDSTGKENIGCVGFGDDKIHLLPHEYASRPCMVGKTLYVRETWFRDNSKYYYRADGESIRIPLLTGETGEFDRADGLRWRPSIHMPKEAARIFLKVTDLKVQRLQDINAEQCIKEGVEPESLEAGEEFTRGIFSDLWDSTVKRKDLDLYGWKANPWVWVYTFEKLEIDAEDKEG